jgi:hypothetical protein
MQVKNKNKMKEETKQKISKRLKRTNRIKRIKYRLKLTAWLLTFSITMWATPKVTAAPYEAMYNRLPEAQNRVISMREFVLGEVAKAGLNVKEVDCLIKSESGWNTWAQGVNNNKTTDSGLFQINSIHKDSISLEDRFDYKKATKWAINKRLHDGNWHAWYGYLANCQ